MSSVNERNARRRSFRVLLVALAFATGCGVKPVPGGTNGTLRSEQGPLGDVQITLHSQVDRGFQPVGFGVADAEGQFQLYANGAQGPLWLPAGEYSCTLESAGSPLQIPDEYQRPESSPLRFVWESGDGQLDLEVPVFD